MRDLFSCTSRQNRRWFLEQNSGSRYFQARCLGRENQDSLVFCDKVTGHPWANTKNMRWGRGACANQVKGRTQMQTRSKEQHRCSPLEPWPAQKPEASSPPWFFPRAFVTCHPALGWVPFYSMGPIAALGISMHQWPPRLMNPQKQPKQPCTQTQVLPCAHLLTCLPMGNA